MISTNHSLPYKMALKLLQPAQLIKEVPDALNYLIDAGQKDMSLRMVIYRLFDQGYALEFPEKFTTNYATGDDATPMEEYIDCMVEELMEPGDSAEDFWLDSKKILDRLSIMSRSIDNIYDNLSTTRPFVTPGSLKEDIVFSLKREERDEDIIEQTSQYLDRFFSGLQPDHLVDFSVDIIDHENRLYFIYKNQYGLIELKRVVKGILPEPGFDLLQRYLSGVEYLSHVPIYAIELGPNRIVNSVKLDSKMKLDLIVRRDEAESYMIDGFQVAGQICYL